jgi:hypothetical protein
MMLQGKLFSQLLVWRAILINTQVLMMNTCEI